jgi:hypothetical protein
MNFKYFIVILIITGTLGCQKSVSIIAEPAAVQQGENNHEGDKPGKSILVDASKDGGVWWSPQSPETGFYANEDHQGKALADYLRSIGYTVKELYRGAVITNELLQKYDKIIRAPAFFPYTDAEIRAYDNFLSRPGALMLLQDHLSYTTNDKLSEHLGIEFAGVLSGTITVFAPHEITSGITEIQYIAGCAVTNANKNPDITVLGFLDNNSFFDVNNNGVYDNGDINSTPVMGILNNYPNTRIFFMGDGNALELLPEPFTQNLISWLFQ